MRHPSRTTLLCQMAQNIQPWALEQLNLIDNHPPCSVPALVGRSLNFGGLGRVRRESAAIERRSPRFKHTRRRRGSYVLASGSLTTLGNQEARLGAVVVHFRPSRPGSSQMRILTKRSSPVAGSS
ncbi:hypothetical protein XPA_010362 [Xanthoria parietina]